jgi:EAL domain-containing protein (putative c-di-GMP-specific phosphodiesterase class I)
MAQRKKQRQVAGNGDPLSAAVSERDRGTLDLVEQAISRKGVLLAYQPVMEANRPKKVAFHEALIRVLDKNGRIIPAREFIETVESRELGRKLDCLALELGLQTLRNNPNVRLSINLSARSMGYPPWMDTLCAGIEGDRNVAERLILEVTEESAMMMPDLVTVFMRDLQSEGICFALDDFGAGMTSFRHLRDFYFDILKIDGQFIRNISKSTDDQVLTEAMVAIARQFDMFTVAECVETAQDAEYLRAIGVDCLQGYYFGAPTTAPPWEKRRGRHAA